MIDMEEWEDLLNVLSSASSEENPEYELAEQSYYDAFGHIPPIAMIPEGIAEDSIVAAIKQCVAQGEEDILKVLGIKLDERFVY